MTVAAIYARKSKATDTGESIQNQLERCRAYAFMKGWEVIEYYDEDYSGGNTNRPAFQRMLQEIDQGKFQNIIFYKLDRVSRNVIDICTFIEELNEKGIGFVSVKENFDTTTPIGRAMLLITAVFAQLERETIAERVKDNMHDLAKKGYWLGGTVPYGYSSEKVNTYNKKITLLNHHSIESSHVQEIYQLYLKKNASINQVKKILDSQGIKTKNNRSFSLSQIKRILNNPIYAIADTDAYQYFESLGCSIDANPEEFDGSFGIIRYHHKSANSNKENPPEEWIISVSKVHQGLIKGNIFVKVQETLSERRNVPKRRSRRGILTGLLYCGDCGGYMGIGDGPKILQTGEKSTYYRCMNKKNNRCQCHNQNIKTDVLDNRILDLFSNLIQGEYSYDDSIRDFIKYGPSKTAELESKRQKIKQEIILLEKNLSRLLEESIYENFPISIIHQKTEEYKNKINYLMRKLEEIDVDIFTYHLEEFNMDEFRNEVKNNHFLENLTQQQQQNLIRKYTDKVFWDSGKLIINFKKEE
ncbi:recombinase family protein [Alkaliphilus transvaalensis]|uniref:recombinase family protein n=1 Tax=Alkaliphilus transvaalensis TaxID=114628 RepID=UPI0006867F13|nr:recombinase family protein [Alkaliphilus transvaalensis]